MLLAGLPTLQSKAAEVPEGTQSEDPRHQRKHIVAQCVPGQAEELVGGHRTGRDSEEGTALAYSGCINDGTVSLHFPPPPLPCLQASP